MPDSEITKPKKRGRPFEKGQSGNPAGKPRGTRHASILLIEALLEGQSKALAEKLLEMALDGNIPAMRLAIERLAPPRRERPLQFRLPPLETAADATVALKCIVAGLADGDLTESEAKVLVGVIEAHLKVFNLVETDRRLSAIEKLLPEIVADNEAMKSMFLGGKE